MHTTSETDVGRPIAHPADKIEYARLLKVQGSSLGGNSASLHRYLARQPAATDS